MLPAPSIQFQNVISIDRRIVRYADDGIKAVATLEAFITSRARHPGPTFATSRHLFIPGFIGVVFTNPKFVLTAFTHGLLQGFECGEVGHFDACSLRTVAMPWTRPARSTVSSLSPATLRISAASMSRNAHVSTVILSSFGLVIVSIPSIIGLPRMMFCRFSSDLLVTPRPRVQMLQEWCGL